MPVEGTWSRSEFQCRPSREFSDLDGRETREFVFNRDLLPVAQIHHRANDRCRGLLELGGDTRHQNIQVVFFRSLGDVQNRFGRVAIPERFVNQVVPPIARAVHLSCRAPVGRNEDSIV